MKYNLLIAQPQPFHAYWSIRREHIYRVDNSQHPFIHINMQLHLYYTILIVQNVHHIKRVYYLHSPHSHILLAFCSSYVCVSEVYCMSAALHNTLYIHIIYAQRRRQQQVVASANKMCCIAF